MKFFLFWLTLCSLDIYALEFKHQGTSSWGRVKVIKNPHVIREGKSYALSSHYLSPMNYIKLCSLFTSDSESQFVFGQYHQALWQEGTAVIEYNELTQDFYVIEKVYKIADNLFCFTRNSNEQNNVAEEIHYNEDNNEVTLVNPYFSDLDGLKYPIKFTMALDHDFDNACYFFGFAPKHTSAKIYIHDSEVSLKTMVTSFDINEFQVPSPGLQMKMEFSKLSRNYLKNILSEITCQIEN
jgi:hypothetical protein